MKELSDIVCDDATIFNHSQLEEQLQSSTF